MPFSFLNNSVRFFVCGMTKGIQRPLGDRTRLKSKPSRYRDRRQAGYRLGRAHPEPGGFRTRWTTNEISWSHRKPSNPNRPAEPGRTECPIPKKWTRPLGRETRGRKARFGEECEATCQGLRWQGQSGGHSRSLTAQKTKASTQSERPQVTDLPGVWPRLPGEAWRGVGGSSSKSYERSPATRARCRVRTMRMEPPTKRAPLSSTKPLQGSVGIGTSSFALWNTLASLRTVSLPCQ